MRVHRVFYAIELGQHRVRILELEARVAMEKLAELRERAFEARLVLCLNHLGFDALQIGKSERMNGLRRQIRSGPAFDEIKIHVLAARNG